MSYKWKVKKGAEENNVVEPKESVQDVLELPFRGNQERGVTRQTCEKFGVRAAVSEKDGKTVVAYYFPSLNARGEVTGFMKQDLTKPKDESGHWTAVGKVGINNKLFGQDIAEQINRKHTNFTVTEGQWDCLSVYQSQLKSLEDTKYEGQEPFVVSIPLGTKNSVEALLHNKDFVKSFDSMTIFFDDDSCTPAEIKKGIMRGKEAREAVAAAFIGEVNLFSVLPQYGYKDANDYLQDYNEAIGDLTARQLALAKLVQFDRKPLITEKIIKASDISFEEIMTPREKGVMLEDFPMLMEKIQGFRKRELVVLTSPSGVGKSSITSKMASAFLDAGERVGMAYLEEETKETVQRLIAERLKVNYLKFKSNPLSVATESQIKEAYDFVANQERLTLLSHFGSMPINELMQKVKHMYFIEGCNWIIIDHITLIVSGADVVDERKEIDTVMTELASFCASHDVCVILVSHINRSNSSQFLAPKGKEDEPYWVRVTKESLRGSSSLEALSWIILGLEPQIMPDRSRGNVRFTVLKNRPWGFLGEADEFSIDQDTWEVVLANNTQNTVSNSNKQVITLEDDIEIPF